MNTFFTIWTKPRKTFECLDKLESDELEWELSYLFYLGSLAIVIPKIVDEYTFIDRFGLGYLIIILLVSSFVVALLLKYVFTFVVWFIGKVVQGKASKFQVQMVMAYSMIPGLISLFISIVLIIIAIIIKDVKIIGYQNPLTHFVIWIFGIRTMIIGLANFNKFSYGFAWINLFIVAGFFQGIAYLIKYLTH